MLMRALFVHVAHGIAGAARIRHSLRPLISKRAGSTCKPRAQCVARTRTHIQCRHPRRRVTQYPRGVSDRTEKPRRTGSSACAEDDGRGWGGIAPPVTPKARFGPPPDESVMPR